MNCATLAEGDHRSSNGAQHQSPPRRPDGRDECRRREEAAYRHSKLPIITADSLAEAAEKAVKRTEEVTMAILINKKTRVITQGISGKAGKFHTEQCMLYGSHYVGGVTPGKGGQRDSRTSGF